MLHRQTIGLDSDIVGVIALAEGEGNKMVDEVNNVIGGDVGDGADILPCARPSEFTEVGLLGGDRGSAIPRQKTRRSSTPQKKRNSCLLWRIWVIATTTGLLTVRSPSA